MKTLILLFTICTLSFSTYSQDQGELMGEWQFQKFIIKKSEFVKKKIVSKKEWSPVTIELKESSFLPQQKFLIPKRKKPLPKASGFLRMAKLI